MNSLLSTNIKKWLAGWAAVTFFVLVGTAAAIRAGESSLEQMALTDAEMGEIRGGFQMANGDFVFFAMDAVQVRFVLNNEPGLQSPSAPFVNSLRQSARITDEGIFFDMDVEQSMSQSPEATDSQTIPELSMNNVIMNNSGIVNANITVGNFNTSSIANLINIRIGFFQVQNPDDVRSALNNWLLLPSF